MRALPLALAACAVGAVLLQWQPMLPPAAPWLGSAVVTGLAAGSCSASGAVRASASCPRCCDARHRGRAALGFGYAAWRAECALADELPARWEGDRRHGRRRRRRSAAGLRRCGTRFAFAVERIETAAPSCRAAVARVVRAARGRTMSRRAPVARRGRALASRRPAQAPARHRQPARLRRRGVAARERIPRDRLRARRRRERATRTRSPGARIDYVQRARAARARRASSRALPDAPYAGVIVALTIGEQRAIPEAQWRVFNRTGITHLISISGLHVTVFAALAGGIAYAARAPQRAAHVARAGAQGRRGRRRGRRRRSTCCSPARRCRRCARC